MTSPRYYTPSGTTPMTGLLLAVLAGALPAAMLGALYAYLSATTGIVVVTAFALIAVGLLTGWLASWVLRRGRVRSRKMAVAASLVIAFVAFAVNWIVWTHTILDLQGIAESWTALIFEPGRLWGHVAEINRWGVWELDREIVRGRDLWIAWGAEALTLMLLNSWVVYRAYSDRPYCEQCGRWCTLGFKFMETTNCSRETMKKGIEAGDFSMLESIGPRGPHDLKWYRLDLHTCDGCGTTSTLSVSHVTQVLSVRHSESLRLKTVVRDLLVDSDDVTRLRAIAEDFKRYS